MLDTVQGAKSASYLNKSIVTPVRYIFFLGMTVRFIGVADLIPTLHRKPFNTTFILRLKKYAFQVYEGNITVSNGFKYEHLEYKEKTMKVPLPNHLIPLNES